MTTSFDRVADIYDNTRSLPPEIGTALITCILRLGRVTPETVFFEPGIGTGRIALPLVEQGYAYVGVDISEQMMDQLRQKLTGKPHRLTLVNADATALPFEADAFDVAIAAHILHLIPDWRMALDELHRVLKPQGVLIYLHHPKSGVATYDVVDRMWDEILATYGYQSNWQGAVTEDVLGYLATQGAEMETVFVAEVTRNRTLAEVLQAYCDRIYSSFWQIPDDLFNQALADLKHRVAATFPSLETTVESSYALTLTAAGWPLT